jgi:hypothetical protein
MSPAITNTLGDGGGMVPCRRLTDSQRVTSDKSFLLGNPSLKSQVFQVVARTASALDQPLILHRGGGRRSWMRVHAHEKTQFDSNGSIEIAKNDSAF